ncbi:FGGY-family carbohydrate kinase [Polymorphospora rubra]|uniref:FGGY-family carbohydrate kinase n=1 Tax=Polymorphospora rubra TaxID=338584 RepID=UPI0033C7AFDC
MHSSPLSTPDLWAGVDVGTQSLRVMVTDGQGLVVGHGSGPLTSRRTGPRHEQDPEQWWRVLGTAFRQALGDLAVDRLRGLAICSTSGTFLLATPDGRPRSAALMYDDARAGVEVEEVSEVGAELWADLGYPMQQTWALPRLVWLLRNGAPTHAADLAHGRLRLLHCADFLAGRLAGTPVATDWTHALKSGYDVEALRWPAEVLDRLDVPETLFPEVVRPGTEIGTVGRIGAAHTGLPVGLPIHAGLTDGCAAQVAAGALEPGGWNSVLGTTLVLKGVTRHRLRDSGGAVYSHRHPDGGWLPGGASNVGAGVLRARFPDADHEQFDDAAARHEPAGGLSYPINGRGERFPFVDPGAEPFEIGTFAGTADRYAGVLQGVAFVERLCLSYLRMLGAPVTGPISVTGGGSRSRYWCQVRADVLGQPVRRPAQPEPAFGMAVVAAAGEKSLAATARGMVRPGQRIDPRPDGQRRFAPAYARFVTELTRRAYLSPELSRHALEAA